MSITKRDFGTTAYGKAVTCWRMENSVGAAIEVLDFGATTRFVQIPDSAGKFRSVCRGFDTIEEYEACDFYPGAVVGRHAGRIAAGKFELNGVSYELACNDGPNHLHGGDQGFSHKVWECEENAEKLIFRYTSPDGEEGYPGTLTLTAVYEWTGDTTLQLTLDAVCDQDTIASFTHHGYWNLSGEDTVANHLFQVHAPTVAEADENILVTGGFMDVEGTPFDFRTPTALGSVWNSDHPRIVPNCGFDNTFPVPGEGMRELGSFAASDMKLTISSTLPTLHIYTGRFTHAALEPQFIPDAIHHPNFPSTVLRAGDRWHHVMEFKFTNI